MGQFMSFRVLCVAVAISLSTGCTHTLKLGSVPSEVEVYSLLPNGLEGNLIGKTPFVPQTLGDEEFLLVKMQKVGYMPRILVVPFYKNLPSDLEINASLVAQNKEWFQTALRQSYASQTDKIVREFLSFQESIILGNDVESKRYIESLGETSSNIATYHSLVGAYYWKKNSLFEARKAYTRLLELNPSDPEAVNMLTAIETMLGI